MASLGHKELKCIYLYFYRAILVLAGVKGSRTTSNNTYEVEKTLGIEAARYGFLSCLKSNYQFHVIEHFISVIDTSHLLIGLVPSGNKPLPEPMLTQIYWHVAIWHH